MYIVKICFFISMFAPIFLSQQIMRIFTYITVLYIHTLCINPDLDVSITDSFTHLHLPIPYFSHIYPFYVIVRCIQFLSYYYVYFVLTIYISNG